MRNLVDNFTKQIQEGIQIGSSFTVNTPSLPIHNVLVSGLGGSGIGGSLVGDLVNKEIKVPYTVNKTYEIPAFVSENTLVVISSYSGNTEETVNALNQALEKKAQIICVTSGGKIAKKAVELGIQCIIIPGGISPRACLCYSFIQLLYILKGKGLISPKLITELQNTAAFLDAESTDIQSQAKEIAAKIFDKIPVLYASDKYDAVAVRWRQQINENGKQLCWHHIIPEMNHNELVGWREKNEKLAVIVFRNADDYTRNTQRADINLKIIKEYTSTILEIKSKGANQLERALYLILLGDYVSCDLADLRGFDPIEVKVIDFLKSSLEALPWN